MHIDEVLHENNVVSTGPDGARIDHITGGPGGQRSPTRPRANRSGTEFQRTQRGSGVVSLGADVGAWRRATDKHQTVLRFARDGIPHMETIALTGWDPRRVCEAFERLGRDVWSRPTIGAGGSDVFHLTTPDQLDKAHRHYCATSQDWLISREARIAGRDGQRHQFRVVVLHDRVLRVCEHVQADPDAPCNESQGAVSTVIAVEDFPTEFAQLAISATRSLGPPFGGVDLAV